MDFATHGQPGKYLFCCAENEEQSPWEESKMPADRLAAIDMRRTQIVRRAELGILSPETMVPICSAPERPGIIVCGGRGTHSVYVPSFGNTRSVTREVIWSA